MDSSVALDMELLKQLSEVGGVPGREERVRALLRGALEGHVDSLEEDALGNLVAVKTSKKKKAKRVMLSAHMDEIGFYVRFVDDAGFLRVHNVGGFDTRNLFARAVTVHAKEGDLIGVLNPAVKPVHLSTPEERKKVPELAEFAVDLGLSAEEVRARVRLGDPVTLRQPFVDLGAVVTGKALDDRVNCFILAQLLRQLDKPSHHVCAVFSVQEEVGLRGATTSAYALEPDIGIALDTTLAVDTPGAPPEGRVTQLGGGVALKVMDSASISTRWLLDAFAALAEERGVPYQLEVLPLGGTDAGAIQRSRKGVATLTLSIPSRYVHTVTEMVAKRDVEASLALLKAYLQG
ncbi:M42 family metallopeptidase [Truepera radiovictrix]|nr:M20/M25/M40 family metallo-hydrolase [Truepera radiovictrix]WMT57411.1 M20/M25/M40 family metallo-hydrolase [Truepera radiovictrix]